MQTVIDNETAMRLKVTTALAAVRRQIARETTTFDNATMAAFLAALLADTELHRDKLVLREA